MTDDPVQRAINIGIASGIVVGLLKRSPFYLTVVTPLLALFGVSAEDLAVEAITAIADAQEHTIAEGWHAEFDPENPARPPHWVKGAQP
jgi:formate-dependent nitrite reductase membrane component NrfD